jgi:hypothetical protein
MMKRIALPLLIASALTVAACGSDDTTTGGGGGGGGGSSSGAPTPAEMLSKGITESTKQKSAAFTMTANVSGDATDPQVKPFLEKPIKLEISGKGSSKAVDISGKANVKGQDYKMAVRADTAQTFIQFMDTWYGPEKGIDQTTQSTGTSPAELKEALEKIKQYGNDVLKGDVSEGDEIDGQKTWKFDGTLNPDGIVKVAQAEGEPMSADDQTTLRAIAPLVKLTFSTGQDDGLFHQLGASFKLNQAQIKALNSSSSQVPLNEIAVDLDVKITDYGTDVKIDAPDNPQPTKALGGALLGAFFSVTGG